jgi:hypothetical protein
VLSQLGNRVQHALRAFTPADAKNIKGTAATFPMSSTINIPAMLTSLGTGDALVSVLDPRGVPTPVVVAKIATPRTLMAGIRPDRYTAVIAASPIAPKYADPNGGDFADDDGASVVLVTRRPPLRLSGATDGCRVCIPDIRGCSDRRHPRTHGHGPKEEMTYDKDNERSRKVG